MTPQSKKSILYQVLLQRSMLVELKSKHSRRGRLKSTSSMQSGPRFMVAKASPVPGIQQVHNKSLLDEQQSFDIAPNYTNTTVNVSHKGLTTIDFIPKTKSEQVVAMITVELLETPHLYMNYGMIRHA